MRARLRVIMIALALAAVGLSGRAAEAPADAGTDYFRSPAFTAPMLAVELQYFRVPREDWDLMLSRMALYHANTISTYIDWGFHEYEEGKFDFTGSTLPQRDLAGFIELCAKHGFKVVLKPGPFIDAEVNAGGIPTWLFQRYPETVALRASGRPWMHNDTKMPRSSYLHPKYLELTRRYFLELGRALAQFEWPRGPVIAVQIDNETPGDGINSFNHWFGENFKADYNDYYVHTAWPAWLQDRYGEIAKLNAAYGAHYAAFSDVPMPRRWTCPATAKQFQIYLDLDAFGEWQYTEALRRYTGYLREAGFRAPTYNDNRCMPWDMAGILGDVGGISQAVGGWLGVNDYAIIYRPWTIFTGDKKYHLNWDEYVHNAIWRVRLSSTLSDPYPAFVPELTSSQRFYLQAPIAWGADAVSIFTGVQTPVDNELIAPKQSWSMECCVTAGGSVRDCLWNTKVMFLFMSESGGFLPGAQKPRVAIAYSHEPEHAWNWEFRNNFDLPHRIPRHLLLQNEVRGTNTNERGQLIARELVRRGIAFDVVHLDHLRPGQLQLYDLVINPQEGRLLESVSTDFRQAWAESTDVDVFQRDHRGSTGAGPCVLSIVNRSKQEFADAVHFRGGEESLTARLGPVAIGFAAVDDGGLRGAVIDHKDGRGEVTYKDERLAFSGTFAAIVNRPGYSLVTAVDDGEVTIRSKLAVRPARLVRLFLDGRAEDAPFRYDAGQNIIAFPYDSGQDAGRTDLYVLLGEGVSLEDALGAYLARIGK